MKKYLFVLAAASVCLFPACTNTTKETEEINNSASVDSAVGNSDAANTIYRDSADLRHATESGGGTGNASNKDQTSPAQSMNADTIRR
jgi:hypothetical protein